MDNPVSLNPIWVLVTRDQLREVLKEGGYTLKEGETDYADYIYQAHLDILNDYRTDVIREYEASGEKGPCVMTTDYSRSEMRHFFMNNGYIVKVGHLDLKDYVYDTAYDVIRLQNKLNTDALDTLKSSGG